MNPMMMNINPMNVMNGNMNNINQTIKKEITVYVKLENNDIINVKCFEDDMASILQDKCHITKNLSCDYKIIFPFKTIKENGITDNSVVNIASSKVMNVNFKTTQGTHFSLVLDGNCPVGMLIILFFINNKKKGLLTKLFTDEIRLSFNATILRIDNRTSIKKYFISPNPTIMVNDTTNLWGR